MIIIVSGAGQKLTEELGDVLGNLMIIANKYNISFDDILSAHKEKLVKRKSIS